MIRFTLGASACGFLMLLPAVASAQLGDGDYVTATDGVWTIEFVREEAIEEDDFYLPAYAGLDSWYSFDSDSELPLFRDHMFREWFYFRTDDGDYSGQEHPIDALTINDISNVNPLSGELQANLIHVSFGQHGVDPIGVSVVFELEETEAGGRGSTIRETIQVQNFLDRSQSVELFVYTDLDMDNSVFNGSATLVDSRTIRQQSFIGSTVDVHVAAGPTPSAFDIAPYADIENLLDDDSPTDLNNNSALGPGDATHAFQWRLNLEAFGLDVGDIETIQLEKIGSFVDLVLPEVGPDGEFIFDEQDPSTTGLPPTWYDPEVLTGYEYEVQAGENAFAELYLPEGFEDGVYTLEILDSSHSRFGELITIEGNGATLRSFDFTADGNSGATAFRIGGIEPEAFIDPDDPLGFPTGLTFVSGTPLRFVQSAVLTNIPEPAGLLLVASAAVVGWPRRIYR